ARVAELPALGPATVQARKTLVSLVGPRRTFAVVQATTKSRVDLGLRLDHERPGGRLLAARDIGAATLRIPLTGPGDIDEEALGWLRRAYDENAAPPPPRRPARRSAAPGTRPGGGSGGAQRWERGTRSARATLQAGPSRHPPSQHSRGGVRQEQGPARPDRAG